MIDLTQLTVSRKLGEGSHGKVFLATDPEGARFAVKLVVLDERADRKLVFERASAFRSDQLDQSIVPILSHGTVSNTPAELARQLGRMSKDALLLVTPFVAGTTLDQVEAQGGLTLREAVAALAGIAAALAKLPAGVGHGDVRAPNIFLRPSGEIALADPDLSSNANPADDLRALAAIGLNLASLSPPVENARAVQMFQTLIADIARPGKPLEASEAATRLAETAILLGAPAGNVTSVLAKRVQATIEAAAKDPGAWTPPAPLGRGRRWVGAAVGVVLLLAAVAAAFSHSWRPRAIAPTPAREGGPAPQSSDSLYDTTGTVHYREAIHPLGKGELMEANDGIVHLNFEYSIARIALLSPREDVLWEMQTPPAGTTMLLDAKPGHYYVEQDRDLGAAGIQKDRRLVTIDMQHPQGITTTKAILNSPHRPTP